MANEEHLQILEQGVEAWNQWRRDNPELRPNLSEADLRGADLRGADLIGADLIGADLTGAKLMGADLSVAELNGADLSGADLSEADLSEADLSGVVLSRADLSRADLRDALVGWTTFGNVDLSVVKGLETVCHSGPSSIGIDTIYRSGGRIPEAFLRGAGVPDSFIEYVASLVGQPIQFYSCFISYSSKDHEAADRLHADLQSKGIRCWFAPEHMRIGDKIRTRIDEVIRRYDKLLLILSENSIESDWVEDEVEAAFDKERQEGREVLFPIRLDDAIKNADEAWVAKIRRTRHIGNFEHWKDHDAYQRAFARLVRDLQREEQ